jgi:2-keto-3-deoxy-galactonokinase
MCSLSATSSALYFASVERMAILPHSEHSFRATRSLDSVAASMMNKVLDGLVLGSEVGEDGREGGKARVASCMSAKAVTALATT